MSSERFGTVRSDRSAISIVFEPANSSGWQRHSLWEAPSSTDTGNALLGDWRTIDKIKRTCLP
jgi:hypothetical protein